MENIGTLTLIVLVLAAYRLTRLVVSDSIPFGNLRIRKVGTKLGELLHCPFCVSVWVGAFLALGHGTVGDEWGWQVFVGAMALSGATSLVASLLPHTFD